MKPTIADVLHHAADKVLWDGSGEMPELGTVAHKAGFRRYSCDAVYVAARQLGVFYKPMYGSIMDGLTNMGVDRCSLDAFKPFNLGPEFCPEEQAARYIWLKLAALMAEEQGV